MAVNRSNSSDGKNSNSSEEGDNNNNNNKHGDKSIVLTYFDNNFRAELTRLTLYAGGVQFEDRRLPKSEWPELKPSIKLVLQTCTSFW